jgi:hypothetical protein
MANVIQQFRFFSVNSPKNYNISDVKDLVTGNFLRTNGFNISSIIQLGIQALPGTRFYLNNLTEPIIIGETGIFELELDGVTEISKIQFDCASLNTISKNVNACLIIDIIYINNNGGDV